MAKGQGQPIKASSRPVQEEQAPASAADQQQQQRSQARGSSQTLPQAYQNSVQSQALPNAQQPRSEAQPLHKGAQGPPLASHGSPDSSSQQFAQHRPPSYLGPVQTTAARNQPEHIQYFAAQPNPYSSASAQGGYSTAGASDLMAATHAMRPPVQTLYNTPQSASPVSVHSPHDTHGRIYNYGSMGYYQPPPNNNNYNIHPGPMQQPSLAPRPGYAMQYSQPHPLQQHPSLNQAPSINSSPTRAIAQAQIPNSQAKYPTISQAPPFGSSGGLPPGPQSSPGSAHNAAAPGPIPATTPLVVRQDNNGVQWIMFEYSRDRIKVQYEIRCDTESVDVKKLPKEHKDQNCVYPRACTKETYQGNRLVYESECNEVGWALAWLNPALKGKRGLIQRAVDSWRNSNQDTKLRSRRVRRLAKNQKRNVAQQQIHSGNQGPTGVAVSPVKNAFPPPPTPTQTGTNVNVSHHHHMPSENGSPTEHVDNSGLPNHDQVRNGSQTQSPAEVRYAQSFHPVYPVNQNMVNTGPPTREAMDGMGQNSTSTSTTIATSLPTSAKNQPMAILDDLPYAKARKNMTVKDRQRDAQTRVVVKLDAMATDDIPDNARYKYSVFPRSHYARQTEVTPMDDADDSEMSPVEGRTQVQIRLEDGWEADFTIPKMRTSKRQRERALNDFGCHIMWGGNIRQFADRPLFLQQALNVFRRDVEDKSAKAGRAVSPLWQVRPGKRKWMERSRITKDDNA